MDKETDMDEAIDRGSRMILVMIVLAFCASLVLGGCASSQLPPSDELAQAQAAINQAQQVGAREYAPLEIREAEKKLQEARNMVEAEEYGEAKNRAEHAMVDAELAEAKSLSARAQQAVQQLKESIRILQEEIQRNLDRS